MVLVDSRPHGRRLVLPALGFVAVTGVTSYVEFLLPDGAVGTPVRWTVLGVGLLVVLRLSLLPWLRWLTTRYVVTERSVVVRRGVLARRSRELPLAAVCDLSSRRSLLQRLSRTGTLTLHTAGSEDVVLDDVPQVVQVQRVLAELLADDATMRSWTATG